MKKRKLKSYLNFVILLFIILLLYTNCESNNDLKSNKETIKISVISDTEISLNLNLENKLKEIETKINNSQSRNSSSKNNKQDFIINTKYANFIEDKNNDYHSYTFPIIRNNENNLLENLLVSLQDDGSYKAFMVVYNLTDDEREKVLNETYVDLTDKISFHELNDISIFSKQSKTETTCGISLDFECWIVPCEIDGCWDSKWTGTECGTVISWGDCGTGGAPDNGDNNEETPCNNCGSNSSSSNTSNEIANLTILTGNFEWKYYADELALCGGFPNDASFQSWVKHHIDESEAILDYLTNNNCSSDSQNIAHDIINNINNGDLSSYTLLVSEVIVDKTDFNNLSDCSKNIYLELEDLSQNGIKKVLNEFCSPESTYNWQIKTETPPINASNDSETDWERNIDDNAIAKSYITYINPNYENIATKHGIARTILHEAIHAFLFSQIDNLNTSTHTNAQQFKNNFPLLWDVYVDDDCSCTANQAQHEAIANLFVNTLASALKEWDKNTQSDQYYKDLAWGGLSSTNIFQTTSSLSNVDRLRIVATNQVEDTNESFSFVDASGTMITINPIGSECD